MSDSKTAIIAAMAAMIMMVSAVAVFAVSDDASADETEKEYSIYIDLGGTVSAYFLGVEEDYGEASWETVQATNAKDALIAACEQKFGEGSITFNDWGGIDTINGMSGSGGSLKSEQSTGWDDVYFYPVQFVKEDGVWEQGSVTIHNYTGESTTFALTFQPSPSTTSLWSTPSLIAATGLSTTSSRAPTAGPDGARSASLTSPWLGLSSKNSPPPWLSETHTRLSSCTLPRTLSTRL